MNVGALSNWRFLITDVLSGQQKQDNSGARKTMNREERRAAMPKCSQFVEQMREIFGEPIGIRASENGHSINWGELIEGEGVEVQVPKRLEHMAGGLKREQS